MPAAGGSHLTLARAGASLLGVKLKPAQEQALTVLCAQRGQFAMGAPLPVPRFTRVVELLPRRVGKTSALFALAVGRCAAVPDYTIVYCAQSGHKSRERYMGLRRELERHAKGLGGFRFRESRGEERIEFANGSRILFLPPIAASFRGDAADLIVLDEAQEIDAADQAGLMGAVLPLMDTKPSGQLVVCGTAAEARRGLLWDSLARGRSGKWGILEYAAEDDDDVDDERVWHRVHPGIGTLTTIEVIRERHDEMTSESFAREYLGRFPQDAATAGINAVTWASAGTEFAARPARFALAFDVAVDRSDAAIVAAWRDTSGQGYVEVVEHRPGTTWLTTRAAELARQHKVPLAYDAIGASLDIADELARSKPRPELVGTNAIEFSTACASFASQVIDGRVQHFRQPPLDHAVAAAGRRTIGDRWAWSRRASGSSISPLVAATLALRAYDQRPARSRPRIVAA